MLMQGAVDAQALMSVDTRRRSIISTMSTQSGDLSSSLRRTSDIVKSMLRSTISRTKRRASKWLVPGCAEVMVALVRQQAHFDKEAVLCILCVSNGTRRPCA